MGGSLTDDEMTELISILPYGLVNAVETGTYMGDTSKVLSRYVKNVYTIEIKSELYEIAKSNNDGINNIMYYLGDTIKLLPDICKRLDQPTLFFIDAHISGADTTWNNTQYVPLLEELDIILSNLINKSNNVFIFDDVRLFDQYHDWKGITVDTIKEKFIGIPMLYEFVDNDRFYVIT